MKKVLFFILIFSILSCGKSQFDTIGDVGDDPFFTYAWHIQNTGQRYLDQAKGTVGADIHATQAYAKGLTGKGIKIFISDTGVDSSHPDLNENFIVGKSLNFATCLHQSPSLTCLQTDYAPPLMLNSDHSTNSSNESEAHGTEVAGVIAAKAKNNIGSRGVAPQSTIAASNFLSTGYINNSSLADFSYAKNLQFDPYFDIINQSWGKASNQTLSDINDIIEDIEYVIEQGRKYLDSNLGTIVVRAAGNYNLNEDNGATINANFEAYNNSPYTIVVGALTNRDLGAWYSLSGTNLWITAPGGDDQFAGLLTTDLTGCLNGESNKVTNIEEKSYFQIGKFGNSNCDYNDSFIGTSAATPVVSGAIALLLEAFPYLNWREVKYILAKSARLVDPNNDGWITNAAGFHFNSKYGFGAIDVDQAMKTADQLKMSPFVPGKTSTIKINPSNFSNNLNIYFNDSDYFKFESNDIDPIFAVQLLISTTDSNQTNSKNQNIQKVCDVKELSISIESPSGTVSQITSGNEALELTNYNKMIFLSNAFFQESSNGIWKVKVSDTNPSNSNTCLISDLQLIFNY